MGLIRKQAGFGLRKTISKWRDSFLENINYTCWADPKDLPVNEDSTIDASQMPRSILHELIDYPDRILPDYVLFDFSKIECILDLSLYEDMYSGLKRQDVLDRLNKIDKYLTNLDVIDIALNSLVVNFRVKRVNGVWQDAKDVPQDDSVWCDCK